MATFWLIKVFKDVELKISFFFVISEIQKQNWRAVLVDILRSPVYSGPGNLKIEKNSNFQFFKKGFTEL